MKKIIVKSLYKFLAFCSRIYLKRTKPYIIWITGTVWKTSSRMIIAQILWKYLKDKVVYTSPKNFNSEIWIVCSIFKIEKFIPSFSYTIKLCFKIVFESLFAWKKYDVVVLEYGVDHPWDMDFLLSVAKPDISVFTRLDNVHVEFFKDKESIWREKFKLMENTKEKVYLNYQDEFCRKNADKLKIPFKYYFWWDIEAKNYNLILEDYKITAKFDVWEGVIKTNLLWEENSDYVVLALDILKTISWNDFMEGKEELFLELENQKWRFWVFKWINGSILVDSSYNCSFKSMNKMIENTTFLQKKVFPDYKVGFVLWDLRELWNESGETHWKLVDILKDVDYLITVWREMKSYVASKISFAKNFLSSREAWEQIRNDLENSGEKYIILFKWSQNTIFVEEALKCVLENKDDVKNLVRQDEEWMRRKERFFESFWEDK